MKNSREDYQALRMLVRAREDFQRMRINMDNRIGRKADGTEQEVEDRHFSEQDLSNFDEIAQQCREQEHDIELMLRRTLKRFDVYNNFLLGVKGIGVISAAHLISSINIEEASTVSKIWQFAGMNAGSIRGKKDVAASSYKGDEDMVTKRYEKAGEERIIFKSDDLVRGDKLKAGFVAPYNQNLKRALLGVLADSFIKSKSPYALDFYYPYKNRLEQSSNEVMHCGQMKAWKDVTPGHRHRAALRYMVKMFLKDLYVKWRTIEGLPVREPYAEEYLGKIHSA